MSRADVCQVFHRMLHSTGPDWTMQSKQHLTIHVGEKGLDTADQTVHTVKL